MISHYYHWIHSKHSFTFIELMHSLKSNNKDLVELSEVAALPELQRHGIR